jgi:hypothetical protein
LSQARETEIAKMLCVLNMQGAPPSRRTTSWTRSMRPQPEPASEACPASRGESVASTPDHGLENVGRIFQKAPAARERENCAAGESERYRGGPSVRTIRPRRAHVAGRHVRSGQRYALSARSRELQQDPPAHRRARPRPSDETRTPRCDIMRGPRAATTAASATPMVLMA